LCLHPRVARSPGRDRLENYGYRATARPRSEPHSQKTGIPTRMMPKVRPVLRGSVTSAFSTMYTEASRNTTGTAG